MQILQTVYNALPTIAEKAARHGIIDGVYNLQQAYCIRKASNDLSFFSRINQVAIPLLILDGISFVATSVDFFLKVEEKYKVITFLSNYSHLNGFVVSVALGAILIGTAWAVTALANKCFKNSLSKNINSAEWIKPTDEKIKQILLVARIVVNIGLAFFSPMGPLFIISAALELYSLIKITQRKWLEFKKEVSTNVYAQDPILSHFRKLVATQIRFTYTFFIQHIPNPAQNSINANNDSCTICQYEQPDTYFCSSHLFHSECIHNLLNHNIETFTQKLTDRNSVSIPRRTTTTTRHHDQHYKYTGSTNSVTYDLNVKNSDIPHCPLCRVTPELSTLSIQLRDVEHGWSNSRINFIST